MTACVQHRFAASGVEGKTMSFLFIIQQQFRAEKSLLSDSTYNELLVINLATVPADGILFPHLRKAAAVGCYTDRPHYNFEKTTEIILELIETMKISIVPSADNSKKQLQKLSLQTENSNKQFILKADFTKHK